MSVQEGLEFIVGGFVFRRVDIEGSRLIVFFIVEVNAVIDRVFGELFGQVASKLS